MANKIDSNPLFFDAASAACGWTDELKKVLQIQLVDDNADIADNNNLIMEINGVTVEHTAQKTTDVGWQPPVINVAGPFANGIPVTDFLLTTMTAGNLIIWLE